MAIKPRPKAVRPNKHVPSLARCLDTMHANVRFLLAIYPTSVNKNALQPRRAFLILIESPW